MTKTMNHTDCPHPATKAARAKCRKLRASHEAADRAGREAIIRAYHDGAELDEIFGMMAQQGIYIDPDLDIEEILGTL